MRKKKGFTLAEVLITLVVIGIIAAITIMIIHSNTQKAEIEAKLKKTVSVLNNALLRATVDYGAISSWPEFNSTLSPNTFTIKYIAPYVITTRKVADNKQDGLTMEELGYESYRIKNPTGGLAPYMPQSAQKFPRVLLSDGSVILRLVTSTTTNSIIFVVDINGPKGPNVAGKDFFYFALEGRMENPSVLPAGVINAKKDNSTGKITITERTLDELIENCKSSGTYCGAIIQKQGWKITKDYPVKI